MNYFIIILAFCFCIFNNANTIETDLGAEIFWKENKPLKWMHFQGYPNYNSEFSAITVSSIKQTINCDVNNNFIFDVKAIFHSYKSWTLTEKNIVLNHEQKHFDLTEVYARKIRKAYAELKNPCDYKLEEISEICVLMMDEMEIVQNQYDAETDHGKIKYAQYYWNEQISELLLKYKKYERLNY